MTNAKAPICAQRLVITGYRGFLRRNYLIQIVNDDVAKLRADVSQTEQLAFQRVRVEQWLTHGVLPREIFFGLLKAWIGQGNLSSSSDLNPSQCNGLVPTPSESFCADVGITFAGFEKLEAHTQLLDIFRQKAPAYAQGAYWRASAHLGDSGPSAPSHWDERYQEDTIHCVLVVHMQSDSPDEAGFSDFEREVLKRFGSAHAPPTNRKVPPKWIEQSKILDDPKKIHFDMLDGLSAPRFEGIDTQARIKAEAAFNVHQPGELLLGHTRNDKSNPWRLPGAYAEETTSTSLRATPAREAYGDFFKDGSFGVLRKMKQNVPEFNRFLKREAGKIQGSRTLDYTVGWLKAKMLGRWPNGEPVGELIETTDDIERNTEKQARVVAKSRPDEHRTDFSVAAGNKFFFKNDVEGYKCPYGAHIRRMNPRDDPVIPLLRRALLRRGVAYGEQLNVGKNDIADRGLLGLFFCANLEEQFEHVLGNWSNNNPMGMPFRQHSKDPLIGNHDAVGNGFEIPMRTGGPLVLKGLQPFVETRGTSYAFFPSVPSLLKIAKRRITTPTLFLENT